MKKSTNILLIIIAIIPIILLLWPFAEWNDVMNLILRIIPSVVVQMLLFRIGRRNIIKIISVLLTGAIAVWGTYLYFTSSHWINATFWDLIADYILPFISCIITLIILFICNKKHLKNGESHYGKVRTNS